MSAVFVGVGSLAVMTARRLLKRGHEVVMIGWNKDRIAARAEELDCGFLHGDGNIIALEPDSRLQRGDEVMIITHSRNIGTLHERWSTGAPLTTAAR